MTTQKHLKARVRSRMTRTGESYAAARAHVVGAGGTTHDAPGQTTVRGIRHFPGIHPETTALRILATHAGLADPATNGAVSEETVLAAGGGLGSGVFAFHYAKEQFSSLYLAGRHGWEDGRPFVEGAARRLGLDVTIAETGSARSADRDLRAALERGPVAAWADFTVLGYRGNPPEHSGGSYHVVVVYDVRDDTAVIGDLAAEPIEVPLADLAKARARIAKQKHRLLSVAASPGSGRTPDLAAATRAGLTAGAEALATEPRRNFSLAALQDLARRMHGSTAADSWARVFPRGGLLWMGLSSMHRFVETYFTGGGLLRPMGGRAVAELATRTHDRSLAAVANRYVGLGAAWTDLATAALPDDVPLLAETRGIQERMAAAFAHGGPAATDELRAGWARLVEIEAEADRAFPLSVDATDRLLASLASRVRGIHAEEVGALTDLRVALAG